MFYGNNFHVILYSVLNYNVYNQLVSVKFNSKIQKSGLSLHALRMDFIYLFNSFSANRKDNI